MKQNNEQLAFYETQLQNSIKNEVFLHDQELSNTSNRISTTKKISFLGSFHRNNLNTSDFQYFHNSDFRSLDQKSIHSSIIQSRLLSLKSSYKNTLKHNKQKLTLKHRRNKTETLLFSNNETFLQQPLVTVNSLLEISPLLEEKESLEMDFFLNFEGDGDWKKKLKKMESLLQEKKNKEKEELNKTRGSLIIKKKTSLEKVANGKLSTCERCNLF